VNSRSFSTVRNVVAGGIYRGLRAYVPKGYLRLTVARGGDVCPIGADTQLVVAGVPGSANSFVRSGLLMVNPELRLASHSHVWTEVSSAVERDLPVLLLIREPLAATASRISRFHADTPRQALRDYARYHQHVLPYRDAVMVVTFEEATERLGDVVERLNTRFGLALRPFPHGDPEHVARLHALLISANGAVPSADREQEAAQLREAMISSPALAPLVSRCQELYGAFVESRGPHR
jgi:hypothetical protein